MFEYLSGLIDRFLALPPEKKAWMAVGFCGNLLFFSRFMVQWIASERKKQSVIPLAFWYLSLVGSLVLLSYAIHRGDPIFILACGPNALVYIRNLWLINRCKPVPAGQNPEKPSG